MKYTDICHKNMNNQKLTRQVEDLRQELLVGAIQLDAGKSIPFDAEQVSNIKNLGRRKARTKKSRVIGINEEEND